MIVAVEHGIQLVNKGVIYFYRNVTQFVQASLHPCLSVVSSTLIMAPHLRSIGTLGFDLLVLLGYCHHHNMNNYPNGRMKLHNLVILITQANNQSTARHMSKAIQDQPTPVN